MPQHHNKGAITLEIVVAIIKYGFLAALAVELALIGRALVNLAREKARQASPAASEE
jgi:hypothetical protein